MELVCKDEAAEEAFEAFEISCKKACLRPNRDKSTFTPGRKITEQKIEEIKTRVNIGCELKPKVLKTGVHGCIPAYINGPVGDMAAIPEGTPEIRAILENRKKFCDRLKLLSKNGLSLQMTMGCLRYRVSTDYGFIGRTCGIPMNERRRLDRMVEEFIWETM